MLKGQIITGRVSIQRENISAISSNIEDPFYGNGEIIIYADGSNDGNKPKNAVKIPQIDVFSDNGGRIFSGSWENFKKQLRAPDIAVYVVVTGGKDIKVFANKKEATEFWSKDPENRKLELQTINY